MRTMKFTIPSYEERLVEVISSTPQVDSRIEEVVEDLSRTPLLEASLLGDR